jgi:hypothetical protein
MPREPDPTLDRIRQVRHEISAEFDHDPAKVVEYYMRLQEERRNRSSEAPPQSAD